ncbi:MULTISPECIES: Ada metal-binding domain-containing protein [Capnocytophaga]|uniref:Ada DNA repair metal-binding domain-containing protein n=1 Tax=Capnocytophaga canis TaxID=1848903 RepID=A0A0B7HRZ8_9FLAO|nr:MULTISPECIES: Ada metal-binding domain-containing protein [Capnocytophaga]ATA72166.1 hypothetical protein CGC49_01880 [Capnocytophaga sp. H4358]ATA74285.1 hypothetical protein CGC52_01825 [Capnocytophaga sp. H2931]CEN42471.1 exported hypothetical protein [Capnocytophaga canis]CEN48567.1 exported hypothetical protein [Capnocytophaga canis]
MFKKIFFLLFIFNLSFIRQVAPLDGNESVIGCVEKIQQSYVGNRNTKKFHRTDCNSVYKIKDKNKTKLKNRKTAIEQGYVPCKICKP